MLKRVAHNVATVRLPVYFRSLCLVKLKFLIYEVGASAWLLCFESKEWLCATYPQRSLSAPLEVEDQERFLSKAEKNSWTREELREAVAQFKTVLTKTPAKNEFKDASEITLYRGIRNSEPSACHKQPEANPLSNHEAALVFWLLGIISG
jgi:hypothetical protein